MNTKNNKRKRESREKIESIFAELLQTRELNQISVSEICKRAGLNRSTFYANYLDLSDLADVVRETLEQNVQDLYQDEIINGYNSNNYLKLFQHIAKNQLFYKTYFKLGYDNEYKIIKYDHQLAKQHFNNRFIEYHMEFFKSGITAIIKRWLKNGCQETPEEINEILTSEYKRREGNLEKK
ncbi:MAG: TetR/AcrR family transcriptional regulator [Clostridiales bacterium]|jgi:AcrR family transcriptional regulator|nr:TetR/AcrR family transcriptional regulator [Clostridiales bacterium]